MTKIRLTITVDCNDEQIAHKVQEEFFPSLNELLQAEGVFGVSAVWLAEAESPVPRRSSLDA
jgi:hypothetical protein